MTQAQQAQRFHPDPPTFDFTFNDMVIGDIGEETGENGTITLGHVDPQEFLKASQALAVVRWGNPDLLDGLTQTEALECIKHTWAVRSAKCLCGDGMNCAWDHDKDPAYWVVLFSDNTLPDGKDVTQDTPRAFPVTIAWWS